MKKLQALCNKNANKIANENLNFLVDLAMVASNTKPTKDEPQTFHEAWKSSQADSQREWQEAIYKEFHDMKEQQVWQKTHKSLMHLNHRGVKNK